MTVRLLVSDVDGTLVRHDKSLSDGNVAAMRELAARGVGVSLISARPPSGLLWIAERLGLPGPFAAFNGGTLFGPDGAILEAHRLDPDLARETYQLIRAGGAIAWAFADGEWVTHATDPVHTPREVKSAGVEPVIADDPGDRFERMDKLVAVSDDDPLLGRVEAAVRAAAGDRATIARSQSYYLDVTAPVANKGDGLLALAARAGVSPGQVAALGDADNDLPMFARAGLSVAMGQASERVRAAATAVAARNDDDGVADAIHRFVLPRLDGEWS